MCIRDRFVPYRPGYYDINQHGMNKAVGMARQLR